MIRTKVAPLLVCATPATAGMLLAADPASASSGVKCTTTAHTGTCIEIIGDGTDTQTITSSHRNDNPDTAGGHFVLTGPGAYRVHSPYIEYHGTSISWTVTIGRTLAAGTYCTRFYIGTGSTPQSGKACAMIHA